jgi:hypothetical protein
MNNRIHSDEEWKLYVKIAVVVALAFMIIAIVPSKLNLQQQK